MIINKAPEDCFEGDTYEEDLFDDSITTVCFTGHRAIPKDKAKAIEQMLDDFLLGLYDRGARIFKAGGAIGFDTMAAKAVLGLKKRFGKDSIHLYLCLPAPEQAKLYSEQSKQDYDYIFANSDGVTYASDKCTKESYLQRNKDLVKGSDVCVAYCTKQKGGTYFTCKQALLSGKEFINIADFLD